MFICIYVLLYFYAYIYFSLEAYRARGAEADGARTAHSRGRRHEGQQRRHGGGPTGALLGKAETDAAWRPTKDGRRAVDGLLWKGRGKIGEVRKREGGKGEGGERKGGEEFRNLDRFNKFSTSDACRFNLTSRK